MEMKSMEMAEIQAEMLKRCTFVLMEPLQAQILAPFAQEDSHLIQIMMNE